MKILNIITAAVLLSVLALAPGCSLLKKKVEKTENKKYNITSVNKTSFRIENTNGKINITGSNDSSNVIRVEAEITAKVKSDEMDKPLDNVNIKIDSAGNEVIIETEINQTNSSFFRKNNAPEVNYTVKIPANMKVHTESVNGSIIITKVNGDVHAETVNGKLSLFGCPGKLELESVNGSIVCNVDSVTAGININITNGDVKVGGLKNINADVNASTVHGKVTIKELEFSELNNERKSVTGILGKGGNPIRIEAVNGKITLDANKYLPKKDDSFEFKIDFDDDEDPIIIKKKENKNGDFNFEFGPEDETEPGKTNDKKADSVKKQQ